LFGSIVPLHARRNISEVVVYLVQSLVRGEVTDYNQNRAIRGVAVGDKLFSILRSDRTQTLGQASRRKMIGMVGRIEGLLYQLETPTIRTVLYTLAEFLIYDVTLHFENFRGQLQVLA
jgi:hypothetical protein